MISNRHTELLVKLAADGTNGTVCDDRERGVDIHAGHESVGRISLFVHALVKQADSNDFLFLNQRLRYRRAGPDLDVAGTLHLRAHPLHELAHRENHSIVLV